MNYEDKHTTMEAPDDQDEISYKCALLDDLSQHCTTRLF